MESANIVGLLWNSPAQVVGKWTKICMQRVWMQQDWREQYVFRNSTSECKIRHLEAQRASERSPDQAGKHRGEKEI